MVANIHAASRARGVKSKQAQRGRMGGLAKAAKYPGAEGTRAARESFLAQFVIEADPDGSLTPEERERRAAALLKLHCAKMAYRSSVARASRMGRKAASA